MVNRAVPGQCGEIPDNYVLLMEDVLEVGNYYLSSDISEMIMPDMNRVIVMHTISLIDLEVVDAIGRLQKNQLS